MLPVIAALLLTTPAAAAEQPFSREAYFARPEVFEPDADYDPDLPTFSGVMGFQAGEWFVSPEEARAYLEQLAAASDRVILTTYGRTYEGRPLSLAIISSPRNLGRLDSIRDDLARLRSLPPLDDASPVAEILEETPVAVWLAYSVHGNEHSGSDAALWTAYHLAADRSARTRDWLESAVVLIDPMQNPDGRARFVRWQEANIGRDARGRPRPDPEKDALEHDEPWPGGRFNHYLFDLNRDWFFLTQVETRGRVRVLREWNPQVMVDLHEMGTDETYFFPPPAAPINPHVAPFIVEWWDVFGDANARALDRFGIDYYTGEVFDAFYPGYGDSLPTYNGAVGMTYEQASARGLAQRRVDGSVLTLREAIWHHFLTSLATVETAAKNRRELLAGFRASFREALQVEDGALAEVWIEPGDGNGSARALAALLGDLGIEVWYPDGKVTNPRLRALVDDHPVPASLAEDGFLISLGQPQRRLIRTLFERHVPMDEAFLQEERAKRRRKEPNAFYDITAWSLPLAYGVRAYWSERPSSGSTTRQPPPIQAGVRGGRGALAYLLRYDRNEAVQALSDLLSERPPLRVQVALKEFRIGDEVFGRGTVVVKTSGGPAGLHETLEEIGLRHGVIFHAARSGRTDEGIDLGSSHVVPLREPRIGLLYGEPASPGSVGWIAYLLEQRYGLDYTRLDPAGLARRDLADYDVLVFPSSSGGSSGDPLGKRYVDLLGEEGIESLRRWIRNGGVFVGIGGGAALAAREEVGWTTSRVVLRPDANGAGSGEDDAPGRGTPDADDLPEATPGAMARVQLDGHHFLTAGYGDWAAIPVLSRLAFTASERGRNVAVFDADEEALVLSGFMWEDTREALAGQGYLVAERMGRGKVILFAGDPGYRAYWPALHRLFLNAILLAPFA